MALILTPTAFSDSQDSQSRRPLVKIISQSELADIPFDGELLTSETTNEQKPNVITHNSGRICLLYQFGTNQLKYVYTDPDRKFFTVMTILTSANIIIGSCLCELENGDIGLLYISDNGSNHYLRRMVISVTGDVVEVDGEIAIDATYDNSDYLIDMPFVIRLADDTYLAVYYEQDVVGATFQIMKRTSADFLTWSTPELECIISNLDSAKQRYNPSLLQIDTGEIFLWFDYVDFVSGVHELTNIYYSISPDNGATWEDAIQLTPAYATYGTVAKHPIAVQKIANQMHLLFFEQSGALNIYHDAVGSCVSGLIPGDFTFDSVDRKLYVKCNGYLTYFNGVLKIDVDTWKIDGCWNTSTTTPQFPDVNASYMLDRDHGEQYYVPVTLSNDVVSVLDGSGISGVIKDYIFADVPAKSLVKNVNVDMNAYWADYIISSTWVDFDTNRLYVLLVAPGFYDCVLKIGYINLTESIIPPALYTWHEVVPADNDWGLWEINGQPTFMVLPSDDYIIVNFGDPTHGGEPFYGGRIKVYNLTSGGLYKDYDFHAVPQFPCSGLIRCGFSNNCIYGGFIYTDGYGQVDYRGLCKIDLATSIITYIRPTWATLDDYQLWNMVLSNDDVFFITTNGYGVTSYNTVSGSWTAPWTTITVPGLLPANTEERFGSIAYDTTTGLIFVGSVIQIGYVIDGVATFNRYGLIKRSYCKIGTYDPMTTDWTFDPKFPLVQGLIDYELVAALDPSNSIYAFWTNQNLLELSIKWDLENSEFDISPYILKGSEVILKRSIDGTPASLTFTVAEGHLFDPHNTLSLWSIYLKKFRKLNLRFGEKIYGYPYWQQQGVFWITENSIGYERPVYPSMSVKAEDQLSMWEFANQCTTPFYENIPEDIIKLILVNLAGLDLIIDIDLPTFDKSVITYIQWVEQPLKGMIDQVCERFGYYARIAYDGKFNAKKISDSNAVDHLYPPDSTKMIRFTPDDSFSDWTNQVMVMAGGRDWLEVIYNEEAIQNLTGSVGWWVKHIRLIVYYSNDHSRRCRYPRMEVITSVKDGPYFSDKGNEYLYYVDPLEKYCIIMIEGPDLMAELIETVVTLLICKIVCYILNAIPMVGGIAALPCLIASLGIMFAIMCILGTQSSYNYNIYARPLGKVRQSFQAVADDLALQTQIGFVNSKKIDEVLAYTLSQCKEVADFELMVVKLQRSRIKFDKLAHLQDEDGDTIQILHPYTQLPMKIFITDLERHFKLPSSSNSNDGSFIDSIEGWKLP